MTVERFYDAMLRREAAASARLDGETWSLPRFQIGQPVWAAGRPAVIVGYRDQGACGAHPGEYRYDIKFSPAPETFNAWPYCESQLSERD